MSELYIEKFYYRILTFPHHPIFRIIGSENKIIFFFFFFLSFGVPDTA